MYMYLFLKSEKVFVAIAITHTYITTVYRIVGKFQGVLIFVIFMTNLLVTKFSTRENF